MNQDLKDLYIRILKHGYKVDSVEQSGDSYKITVALGLNDDIIRKLTYYLGPNGTLETERTIIIRGMV